MLTYKRIIESTEIIIHIEEQLYNYMPNIFNSIFCTFELCNNNICNPNTIHILTKFWTEPKSQPQPLSSEAL